MGDRRWRPQGLRRAGVPIQSEMLPQLRFGRALDNRRYKATGFVYQHTTRETVLRLREQQRLEPILRGAVGSSYRYESAVEEFLRFSPSVRQSNVRPAPLPPANSAPGERPEPDQLEAPAPSSDGLRLPAGARDPHDPALAQPRGSAHAA